MPAMSTTDAGPGMSDHRVYLHDVSWEDYQRLLRMRGEKAVPSITYLEGEVELMSPSQQHEWISSTIGKLLGAWSEESGVVMTAFGRWTLKRRRRSRGLEPDECYVLGVQPKPRPDLAIEVVWTSGGLDKLEVYRGLGVPEVWFWQNGRIDIHVLEQDRYCQQPRSLLLPDLDLSELTSFVEQPSQWHAVKEYRELLRRRFATD